jgi:hypothetical protein
MILLQIIIWISIAASVIGLFILIKPIVVKEPRPEWKEIAANKLKDLQTNKKLDDKYKILELDKIMEFILQSMFNSSRSFGEILKENEKVFEPVARHQIWVAHKLRNKIVHDINYHGSKNEFTTNIKKYIKNIKDLLI